MQIVIEIPDKRYKDIQRIASVQLEDRYYQTVEQIIARGTPLPKGHGRLIDADELYLDIQTDEEMRLGEHLEWVKNRFDNAPTIIEADKEESEDNE